MLQTPSRENVAINIRNWVLYIVVDIEMFAKPFNPFDMSEQCLLTLYITLMDPLNQIHGPQVKNLCFRVYFVNTFCRYKILLRAPTVFLHSNRAAH